MYAFIILINVYYNYTITWIKKKSSNELKYVLYWNVHLFFLIVITVLLFN